MADLSLPSSSDRAAPSSAGTRWRKPARPPAWERYGGLGLVVLLHVGVLWALLQLAPVQKALIAAAPIMVQFITPPKPEEPPKQSTPPKPRPVAPMPVRKTLPPPPLVTTRAEKAASPVVAPPAPKAPVLAPLDAPPAPKAPQAVVTPPGFGAAYLNNPPPVYPLAARRNREEGKVLLKVFVSAAGAVEKIELHTTSGSARLDQAAQDAVRGWRFVPARQGDTSVAAWVIVPIKFTLEG